MNRKSFAYLGLSVLLLSFVTPASPALAATPPSGYWTVAAGGERAVVFAQTALNTPVLNNGSYFYFTDSRSMGFSAKSTINQGWADIENRSPCDAGNGDLRLSWHLGLGVGGFRAGCSLLNESDQARAVYQSNNAASLWVTGPAKNVSHETLLNNGWSLCYDDQYQVALSANGSEVTTACTQTYVLLAGGNGVAGEESVEAGPAGIALTVPNVPGSPAAGLPIYYGTNKTEIDGAFSLTLSGPQGRTVLASGHSAYDGGFVGMVRLPGGMQQGTQTLTLRNRSAELTSLVLTVILTIDANGILVSQKQG